MNTTQSSASNAIAALRFIDQIDFYLWQASGNEATVLSKIPATLTNAQQTAWYNKLLASVSPRALTLSDIRAALLRDFGVDPRTAKAVLARYDDGGVMSYLRSQSFKLVMNYIDELEGLKERERRLVTEKEVLEKRWGRALVKAENCHKAETNEKQRMVEGLGRKVEELQMAVKGLTAMVAAGEGRCGIDEAWERFEDEVSSAQERFRKVLRGVPPGAVKAKSKVAGSTESDKPVLPESYRRPDTPTAEKGEEELMGAAVTLKSSRRGNLSPAPERAQRDGSELPLRRLLQNERPKAIRVRRFDSKTKPYIHTDARDRPASEDRQARESSVD